MSKINKKLLSKIINVSLAPNEAPVNMSYTDASTHMKAALARGQFDISEHIAEQLTTLAPKELIPRLVLFRSAVQLSDILKANQYIEKLLKDFPRDVNVLTAVASYYQMFGNPAEATKYYEKLIKFKPKSSDAYFGLGNCSLSSGNKEMALKHFEKARSLSPKKATIYFSIVNILKGQTSDEIISKIESLASEDGISPEDKAIFYFSLASIYSERDKEREKEYLIDANKLVNEFRPWDINQWLANIDAYKSIDYGEMAIEMSSAGNKNLSPIFIVSMPRSGSTLLDQIFGAHSKVKNLGETGAFSRSDKTASILLQSQDDEWTDADYLHKIDELFCEEIKARCNGESVRIADKSMNTSLAVGQILLTYPNAKIVYLKRNPNAIALSCFQTYFGAGQEFSFNLEACADYYHHFTKLMEHWLSVFPSSIHTIAYEDLVQNPEDELKELLDFCDLEWEDDCLNFHNNAQFITTASNMQANQPIYGSSKERWREYEDMLTPFINRLSQLGT